MKVVWTSKANTAVRQTIKYIETNFGRRSVLEFADAVASSESYLSAHPYIGKTEPLLDGRSFMYRCLIVKRLNKIIYYIDNDNIIITDFWNLRQSPKNLQQRVK